MAPAMSKPPSGGGEALPRRLREHLDCLLGEVEVLLRSGLDLTDSVATRLGKLLDYAAPDNVPLTDPSGLAAYILGTDGEKGKRPLRDRLPRYFIFFLLAALYNAFVFGYMPAAGLALTSPTSLVFHAFVYLILANWLKAAEVTPGEVPDEGRWRDPGKPPSECWTRDWDTGEHRWSRRHKCWMPDRAHHCAESGRVVLRMDHYCVWLNNTVGHGNHKFFFLLLLYSNCAFAMLHVGIWSLLLKATLPTLTKLTLLSAEALCTVLSGVLLPFFAWHCRLLFRNRTTIECLKAHKDEANPWDMGAYRNIQSVMGDNPWSWLMPWGGPTGDGVDFERNTDSAFWPQSSGDNDAASPAGDDDAEVCDDAEPEAVAGGCSRDAVAVAAPATTRPSERDEDPPKSRDGRGRSCGFPGMASPRAPSGCVPDRGLEGSGVQCAFAVCQDVTGAVADGWRRFAGLCAKPTGATPPLSRVVPEVKQMSDDARRAWTASAAGGDFL